MWTLRSVQQHHRCLRNPALFKPGCGVFVFGQCSPFHRSQLCFVCPCATSSAPSKRAASLQTSRTQRLALFLGCEHPHRAVQDTTLFAQPCCCPSRSASPRGAAPCRDLALSVDLITERSEENQKGSGIVWCADGGVFPCGLGEKLYQILLPGASTECCGSVAKTRACFKDFLDERAESCRH